MICGGTFTPFRRMRDIVDKCRVWDSHADADGRCHVGMLGERPGGQTGGLSSGGWSYPLVQKLLLSVPALAPPPRPVPVEMEMMFKRLLSLAPVPVPASPPRSAITVRETGPRRLLQPQTPTLAPWSGPISTRKDWAAMVLFPFADPFDCVDTLSTSRVSPLPAPPGFTPIGVVGYAVGYCGYDVSGFTFTSTAGVARGRCHPVGFADCEGN